MRVVVAATSDTVRVSGLACIAAAAAGLAELNRDQVL